METYRIERLYQKSDRRDTVRCHLTLEEAQAHCRDPETSSSTCTDDEGAERTRAHGAWFDSYTEE